jgi:pectinesterase
VPTTNVIQWGRRVYYYNCHREGGDYSWFANHLPSAVNEKDITVNWLFKNKWHPEIDLPTLKIKTETNE